MTTLTTDRLTLRPHHLSDWPAFRDFYASDRAGFVGGPVEVRQAWWYFAGDRGHWDLHGYGWFMIEDATGVIGTCGPHFPAHHAEIEIGWFLFAGAEGRGYATEAARAALDWAWTVIDAPRIVSYIDAGNTASKRVAARLGAAWDGTMAAHDPACEVWVHERPAA